MSEKIADRRTLKTRRAIRDALAILLTDRELNKVTVKDITDIADINRVTFYKHYLDVYDLYDKTEQEILIEIGELVLQLEDLPSDKFFSSLIDFIDGNRTIFKMIFSPNSKATLLAKFSKCIDGLFRQIESEKYGISLDDDRLRYLTRYRSQGCIAVIMQWVAEDFSASKDFIVKTISELDTNTETLFKSNPKSTSGRIKK